MDICEKIEKFLTESTQIETSKSAVLTEKMQDLMSRLVCATQYAKVLHWNTPSGSAHVSYDNIYYALRDEIDDFAEKYFMSRNIPVINPLRNGATYAAGDFGDRLAEMNNLVENICSDPACDESMKSMVSGIGESVQKSMGFYRQAVNDETAASK